MNEREARALLTAATEPGDKEIGRLINERGAAQAAFTPAALGKIRVMDEEAPGVMVAKLFNTASTLGIRFITPEDDEWPTEAFSELRALNTEPYGLWFQGRADLLLDSTQRISFVGARAATGYGEHVTWEMVTDLSTTNAIVSGAAYGIDGAAHRATLAAEGNTVAVLAGGVDRYYPAGHQELIAQIAKKGTVVSEMAPGSAPTKWRFLARNRLIAALGSAVVVVEAGNRSGSLNSAGHANRIGRPVGAVPGPVTSPASAGCHRLIREYGAALVTDATDVRELLS